ncbi:hypothetical protein D3C86_1404200 [compost metagenome]
MRSTGESFRYRDLAIRHRLCGRVRLPRHIWPGVQQLFAGGIEIPDPQLRRKAKRPGMAHAAIGRNHTAIRDRLFQTIGHRDIAAKQNGETLFIHALPYRTSAKNGKPKPR